ncbi:Ger(x)C family spore germination protein [Clostridium estertheticum]|uniref:Ger(x)C family spore germination C-terminal domain-containing protein n=1 Tax=Clostridium estertheticum TaxID=238834 RepID=UPI001CF15405|nr:Ger(x)C family spore germination C-terminal domain-containing protein [Clostridium estertheticum]MCB2305415.1 Ger(x)C family spore germination protein [Clostridium estertheticum]MCB2343853.1 Ger(x)C family spore germination protein [Clostridium estertheticum]MCB2348771.1 Ger(x)C family spore germination protein [Clostridium estertheticum]WAG46093.1 Ger(x)C family spore germination protein [Clostridium estertheticum]
MKKVIIVLLVVSIVSIYAEKLQVSPMEELNITAGVGYDINKGLNGGVEYRVPISIYDFKTEGKEGAGSSIKNSTKLIKGSDLSSSIIKTKANTIAEIRQQRQLNTSKPFTIGTPKITVIGEQQAFYGITNIVNILFFNAKVNDKVVFAVVKGKAEDILRVKVAGYPSAADYMEGIVRHGTNYNFFNAEYNLLNIYVTLDSEGKNLVLPYLEIKDKNIAITGMALFKGDKMAYVIPMEEGKIMNMLREKKGKGILSLQEGPDKYINYDATVKRKVKCNKIKGKYEFIIDLEFHGDIIENTLDKSIKKESEKEFKELISKKIEMRCYDFLCKMKNSYKVDCLNLGMYAAAKYGRESGVDWNKEVSNSDVRVNVVVNIDKIGIGQY